MGQSVHLRLPDDLAIGLAERSRVEGRTLAGLILHLLRGSVLPAPRPDPPIGKLRETPGPLLHVDPTPDPNELRYEKV